MAEINCEDKPLEDLLTVAQLEKLNLEIANLKNKNSWDKRLALYTPIISVSIAVGGFLFGVYQFQRQQQIQQNQLIAEQQRERATKDAEQVLRIQNQIRSDVEQILQFPSDKQQTTSKVTFLLQDLKSYLELSENNQTASSQNNKRSISATLVSTMVNDCNFDLHRDINYSTTLINHWEDLGRYLDEEDSTSLEFILSKYNEALRNIYLADPITIMSVRYVEEQNSFSYPKGYGKLTATQLFHFQSIIGGFERYLEIIKDEKVREMHLIRFQGAMCNGELMEQYFGVKFSRRSEPGEFVNCPK